MKNKKRNLEYIQGHLIKEISFYTSKIEESNREIKYAAEQIQKLKFYLNDIQRIIQELERHKITETLKY